MVFHPQTMFDTFGHDEVCRDIDDFINKNSLSMFAIVCNVMNAEGKNEKYLFVYSKENDDFARTFDDLTAAMKKSDYLRCGEERSGKFGGSRYAWYMLENTAISRKKFEIVFRDFYQ